MDILNGFEEAFIIDDNLFCNFSEDRGDSKSSSTLKHGDCDFSSSLEPSNKKKTAFGPETQNDSFPELMEGLEWLMDDDSIPSVESCFGVLSDDSEFMLNHLSPISDDSEFMLNHLSPISVFDTVNNDGSSYNNLKVPINHPKGTRSSKRRRRMAGYGDLPNQHCLWSNDLRAQIGQESVLLGRRCQHCLADNTPQWRAGPMGPKTLCNACGVRYKSGRLHPEYRPACSPTFSTLLHSNSHKKVIEMRMKKQG